MNKKVTALVLMAAAWVIFLPSQSNAAVVEENVNLVNVSPANNSLFVQNRRWNRNRNRNWNRNRSWNRNRRGNARVVRQYYYRNGRRYVRTVRVYR